MYHIFLRFPYVWLRLFTHCCYFYYSCVRSEPLFLLCVCVCVCDFETLLNEALALSLARSRMYRGGADASESTTAGFR